MFLLRLGRTSTEPDIGCRMSRKLVIVGAGGFAREVLQIVLDINALTPTWDFHGFLVTGDHPAPERLHDFPVHRGVDALSKFADAAEIHGVIAVGNSVHRHRLARFLGSSALKWTHLIHPRAWLGRNVKVGPGTVICAGATVTTDIRLGAHVHVNINCTIGHDAILEDCVTLNPGTCVSGNVHLGPGTECGTGAIVIPGVSVGAWSILGAGAVVTKDLPSNVTSVGAPARIVKTHVPGWQEG